MTPWDCSLQAPPSMGFSESTGMGATAFSVKTITSINNSKLFCEYSISDSGFMRWGETQHSQHNIESKEWKSRTTYMTSRFAIKLQ